MDYFGNEHVDVRRVGSTIQLMITKERGLGQRFYHVGDVWSSIVDLESRILRQLRD